MKKKLVTVLTASTLALVGCGNSEDQEDPSETAEQSEQVETDTAQAQESNQNQELEQQTQFIQEGFDTLLNYDTDTYRQRNEEAGNYFSNQAVEAMTGYDHIDPQVSFNSSTHNEKIYQSLQSDNGFIYIAEVSFQVEDNPATPVQNIYEFELLEQDGDYRIDNVQTFAQPIRQQQDPSQ